jgi:hypothetical protein
VHQRIAAAEFATLDQDVIERVTARSTPLDLGREVLPARLDEIIGDTQIASICASVRTIISGIPSIATR